MNLVKKLFSIDIDHLHDQGNFVLSARFWSFIWFFLRQVKWLLLVIGLLAAVEAIFISFTYWYIGQVVEQTRFEAGFLLLGLGLIAGRAIAQESLRYFENILFLPYFGNMVRRQCFYYTANHSLSYFQNDFAGRIANKLLQCGPALRDATLSVVVALVFVGTLFVSNILLVTNVHPLLALPQLVWLIGYISTMSYFLPRIKKRSTITAESMSTLTGQVVDSLTNILTAKYYARLRHEDKRATGFIQTHGDNIEKALFLSTMQSVVVSIINAALIASTMAIGYWLVTTHEAVGISALAMALPMVFQMTFWSGWIMREMAGIFENLGTVQEGIDALSKPHTVEDRPDATDLDLQGKAPSALDSESEHAIQTALEGVMHGKTVIAIAHRLSTLRQMDRIIVMEQGRIIEDGTHEALVQKEDGHYARLWSMQSGGFLLSSGHGD